MVAQLLQGETDIIRENCVEHFFAVMTYVELVVDLKRTSHSVCRYILRDPCKRW